MRRVHGHDARHRAPASEQSDPVALDLLIEQGIESRSAADAPQRDVAVVRDVADHVAGLVESAVDEAFGPAAAEGHRHVPGAIAGAAGQQREQRIGDGLFVARDGGHS